MAHLPSFCLRVLSGALKFEVDSFSFSAFKMKEGKLGRESATEPAEKVIRGLEREGGTTACETAGK